MAQKRIYCKEIMLLLARTLSVYTVSCVHQSNSGVLKSWLDEKLQVHDDGIVSMDDIEKRKQSQKSKRTSWESTGNIDSQLFDDKNLTLCLRLPSPIDNLDDIYYVTVRPTLGSINIMVSSGYETRMSVQDKEIIASLCYSVSSSLVEILKSSNAKEQMLMEDIRHKDRTIAALKREIEIPANKTMKIVKEKLFALGKLYETEFVLSKDAENMINEYAGDNMTPILKALERAALIKSEVYGYSRIEIDDADLQIKQEEQTETTQISQENVIEKRHTKTITYLERLEDAYNTAMEHGQKPTALNIASYMGVSSASITMWFKKHSDDARRMCENNINLCKNSRRYFEPLKEAVAGKKNKAIPA